MSEIRLQKFLSQCGVASRRRAEALILEGKVRVNDVLVRELGTKIDPAVDRVICAGKNIQIQEGHSYILLNKPRQVMVTRHDPQQRKTVYHLISGLHSSMRSVGRLDFDSEGLLLLTNDGELAFRLTHPSYEIKKTYHVQLNRCPSPEKIKQLEKGILLEGEKTAQARIQNVIPPLRIRGGQGELRKRHNSSRPPLILRGGDQEIWFSVEIYEGKKRQVRRMFEWTGCKVLRLIRVKLGSLELGNLPRGKWRELKKEEVLKLKRGVKI